MFSSAARWFVGHPRLIYTAIVPGITVGLGWGYYLGGVFGGFGGGEIGLLVSGYLYVLLRMRLKGLLAESPN